MPTLRWLYRTARLHYDGFISKSSNYLSIPSCDSNISRDLALRSTFLYS
jgi:hypothetical protein